MAQRIKKQLFRILPLSLVALMVLALAIGIWQNSTSTVRAAVGEGTATIADITGTPGAEGPGVGVTAERAVSDVFTVVLTVGVTGITAAADNPTFTIPASFTAPDAAPVANAGLVVANGNWSATAAGGTCAVTMGSSSAAGQIMTVDVTGACATTNTITLTYKGLRSTVMGATALMISTDDAALGGPATPIAAPPTITVTDTIAPTAPLTPTAAAGPIINSAEKTAGVAVIVGLGTSGAVAGDTLNLLINGVAFGTISQTHVLNVPEVVAGTYTFTVPTGADDVRWVDTATPALTAKVTDIATNVGAASPALNLSIDTTAPTVTVGCISVQGANGLGTAFIYTDDPVLTWNNNNPGAGCTNNNTDIASVSFNASAFKAGDTARTGVNTLNVWEAHLSAPGLSGAPQDDINNNISVTAVDNAGNSTTVSGTNNYIVDTILPIISVPGTVTKTIDVGGDGIASVGDTITYAAGTETTGDSVTWTVNLLAYGLSPVATPGPYILPADNDDGAFNATETVTDDAGNNQFGGATAVTEVGFTNIDNIAPVVTQPNIATNISGCTGTTGECIIGNTVIAEWDDTFTPGGDNNTDVSLGSGSVVFGFAAYGGGAVAGVKDDGGATVDCPSGTSAVIDAGLWCASYPIAIGGIDGAASVTATVTDDALNITGPITSSMIDQVDNDVPVVTQPNITTNTSACTGSTGECIIGNTVIAEWDDTFTLGGDNNPDVTTGLGFVSFGFAAYGGGAVAGAEDDGFMVECPSGTAAFSDAGLWCASYPIVAGGIEGAASVTATVTDDAGNTTGPITSSIIDQVDNQAPSLQSFTSTTGNDTYGPGMAINITATYDEPLSGVSSILVTLDNGATVALNGVTGNAVEGIYNIGSLEDSLDLTVSSITWENVADSAGNFQATSVVPGAPNNIADTSAIVVDTTAPTIVSATTLDNDRNGQINQITVVYNEPVDDADYNAFSAAGYTMPGSGSGTGMLTVIYNLTESGSFDTDAVPVLTWTDANAQDLAGNLLDSSGAPATADGAAPVIKNFAYQDVDHDGKIDHFTVGYSEPVVETSTLSADNLNLFDDGDFNGATFGADAGDLISDTVTSTIVNLGTEASVVDTNNAGTIRILTQGGFPLPPFSLEDETGNVNTAAAEQTQATYTDLAAPVIVSTSPASGASGIAITANVVVNFSEPMLPLSVSHTSAADPGGWSAFWLFSNSVTYSHTSFANNTSYTQHITGGQDQAFNSLAGSLVPNPWIFTTIASAVVVGGGGYTPPDNTLPVASSISVAGGAAQTVSKEAVLALSATNAAQMMISNSSDFSGAVWETYATSKTWTLTDNYGTKTVYAKFKNATGSISSVISDAIDYVATLTIPLTEPVNLVLTDPVPAPALPPQVTIGTLVKLATSGSVYFIDQDNRRHAFPNEAVYLSYYPDFSGIQTISGSIMAEIPLGSNVTMRPGTYLVKIQSDPKVYAVAPYGVLKGIGSEAIAVSLYGADWATRVVDVEPTFFINYQIGSAITTATLPTGSAFSYQGDSKVYYVDGGNKRFVSSAVFSSNKFQNKFVIRNLATSNTFPDGADLPSQGMEVIMTLR